MVALSTVLSSNARIATELPSSLVAVFTGATSGIGEYTLLALAKHTVKPRIYFVGRSQDAANRIIAEARRLNPEGSYVFLKGDLSLLRNIDNICEEAGDDKRAHRETAAT